MQELLRAEDIVSWQCQPCSDEAEAFLSDDNVPTAYFLLDPQQAQLSKKENVGHQAHRFREMAS